MVTVPLRRDTIWTGVRRTLSPSSFHTLGSSFMRARKYIVGTTLPSAQRRLPGSVSALHSAKSSSHPFGSALWPVAVVPAASRVMAKQACAVVFRQVLLERIEQVVEVVLGGLGVLFPATRPFGQISEQALGLLFLKNGRDDELQADSLGARVRFIEPGEGSDREAGLRLLAAETTRGSFAPAASASPVLPW